MDNTSKAQPKAKATYISSHITPNDGLVFTFLINHSHYENYQYIGYPKDEAFHLATRRAAAQAVEEFQFINQ